VLGLTSEGITWVFLQPLQMRGDMCCGFCTDEGMRQWKAGRTATWFRGQVYEARRRWLRFLLCLTRRVCGIPRNGLRRTASRQDRPRRRFQGGTNRCETVHVQDGRTGAVILEGKGGRCYSGVLTDWRADFLAHATLVIQCDGKARLFMARVYSYEASTDSARTPQLCSWCAHNRNTGGCPQIG